MKLLQLAETSEQLSRTRSRLEKTALLANMLNALGSREVRPACAFMIGELLQGKIGIGPALLRRAASVAPASHSGLTLSDLQARLDEFAALKGAGSNADKVNRLQALFSQATEREQRFLRRLLLGELRQGALEGLMAEAIAQAFQLPSRSVRRAIMVSGSVVDVAEAARLKGRDGVDGFRLRLLTPLKPMLAQTAEDVTETLMDMAPAILEYKLDGVRVQVHRDQQEVGVFTRQLHDVTAMVPEIVEAVLALPTRQLVLDGEAIAIRSGGRPLPFQTTMRRFGRRQDVATQRRKLPLCSFYFDCLHLDGEDILDLPTSERHRALDDLVPASSIVSRTLVSESEAARAFLARSLADGHEGIMAKSPTAAYQAGNRGSAWRKIKQAQTLDLVVIAAEWGSGRRKGWLSNLHLGARSPDTGQYIMLGKTFKGLTDKMLAWQTERLQHLTLGEEGQVVHVRPELVVEIAFNELQQSAQYAGGIALRFARVKRYRTDKTPAQADDLDSVQRLFLQQTQRLESS